MSAPAASAVVSDPSSSGLPQRPPRRHNNDKKGKHSNNNSVDQSNNNQSQQQQQQQVQSQPQQQPTSSPSRPPKQQRNNNNNKDKARASPPPAAAAAPAAATAAPSSSAASAPASEVIASSPQKHNRNNSNNSNSNNRQQRHRKNASSVTASSPSPSGSPAPDAQPAAASSSSSAPAAASSAATPQSPHHQHHQLDPNAKYIGAIDQGTSSTRFMLFDSQGAIVRVAQEEIRQIHVKDQPGWAEHDPLGILHSVESCIKHVLSQSPAIQPQQIVGIGITNQRETTVMWDKNTGKPLHNALVWHDTRTVDLVKEMSEKYTDGKDHFRASAGLPISTYFSALKMKWLMQNVPAVSQAVKEGRALAGTIDSWLIWNLTGGVHVTDVSNASRTMLMNLQSLQWDAENCKEFGIPTAILPSIRSNAEVYGNVQSGLLKGVPISGCVGDQQAAMLGQLCFKEGDAKNTFGTGAFMLMNTGTTPVPSTHGLLTTVCFKLGSSTPCVYALEGSVAVAGSAVRWMRDEMKLIKHAKDINTLAGSVHDANDVYFVPAFSGLLAPYWRDDARGVIAGLTHSSTSGHLARAVLYSSAYQTREVLDAMMADTKGKVALTSLKVDGGMCASELLMQFQADQLAIPVIRPASLEATATGAAFCAGLSTGFWKDPSQFTQLMNSKPGVKTFRPRMKMEEREKLFRGWKKAVHRTFGWIESKEEASRKPISATVVPVAHSAASIAPSPVPTSLSSSASSSSTAAAGSVATNAARRFSPLMSNLAALSTGLLLGCGIATLFLQGKNKK